MEYIAEEILTYIKPIKIFMFHCYELCYYHPRYSCAYFSYKSAYSALRTDFFDVIMDNYDMNDYDMDDYDDIIKKFDICFANEMDDCEYFYATNAKEFRTCCTLDDDEKYYFMHIYSVEVCP